MQSGREDTVEHRYAIKVCFQLGKNVTETYGMLQTAFGASCMNRASGFERRKRFKEGKESVRDDERCARSKEVNTPELIGQRVRVRGYSVEVLREFSKRSCRKRPALFVSGISTRTMHHPCHRLFDQDGHQDKSSASLKSRPCSL